jgi:outer membrane protein
VFDYQNIAALRCPKLLMMFQAPDDKTGGTRMNFRRLCTIGVLAGLMILSFPALAQQKFGFVNIQRAVAESKEGKAVLKKLQDQTTRKQKELNTKQDELKKLEDNMKTQGTMWNDDMKRTKLQEYQKKGLELQEFYAANQKELAEREQELTTPLLTRFEKIILKIGKDESYTAILHSTAGLFVSDKVDLTDRVIQLFDAGSGK